MFVKENPDRKKNKNKDKTLIRLNLLAELPFYEQLSIIKTDQAFREYAR